MVRLFATFPVGGQGAFGHFPKIEVFTDFLLEQLPALRDLVRGFELFVGHQPDHFINGAFHDSGRSLPTQGQTHPPHKNKRKSDPVADQQFFVGGWSHPISFLRCPPQTDLEWSIGITCFSFFDY